MRAGKSSTSHAAIGAYTIVTYSARRKTRKTTIGTLTLLMSAAAGYFAALMASPIVLSNAPSCVLRSAAARMRPSNDGITASAPTFAIASVPAGAASLWYGIAFRASQPLAMSQDEVNLRLPTGSNWNEQSPSDATTVTGL